MLRVKDFEASKSFYTEILNLEIIEEYQDEDGSRGCEMRVGEKGSNALIEISEIPKDNSFYDTSFSQNFENNKVCIEIKTDAIDYWAKRLKEKWKARGPVPRPWGAEYLYLRDPDSLQIIIYQ